MTWCRCRARTAWPPSSSTAPSGCCAVLPRLPSAESQPQESATPMPQDPLRDQLDYFQELGVDGLHPDPLWRARADVRSRGSSDPPQENADRVIPVEAVRGSDTLAIIK